MNLNTPIILLLICMTMATSRADAAQTCNSNMVATAPASRFVVNADQTVNDKLTGLTWKQCAQGLSGAGCATGTATTHDWASALSLADAENFAGKMDWRLPNVKEFASIVEQACSRPAINATVFPNTGSSGSFFWSASPAANFTTSTWSLIIDLGEIINVTRAVSQRVWLVRGGQ